MDQLQMYPVNKLRVDPANPRREKDKEAIEALATNIKEFGMINPLEISKDGVVITGNSRFQAAKLAGLKEVPVKIIERDNETVLRQLSENIVRSEMSPIDIAKAIEGYMIKFPGLQNKQYAKKLGMNYHNFERHIQVMKQMQIGGSVKELEALAKGKMQLTEFQTLRTAPKELQARLVDAVIAGDITGKSVGQLVAYYKKHKDETVIDKVIAAKMNSSQTEKYLAKLDVSFSSQMKTNFQPGQNIILAASDLALALSAVKKLNDITKLQLGRVSLALGQVESELSTFKKRL